MSVTTETTTAECKACETPIDRFYTPGYCSATCYYRHQGAKAVRHIEHDHTRCATCFRPVKSLEPPPEHTSVTVPPAEHDGAPQHTSDVLIGYQYPTEYTEVAVDERTRNGGDRPRDRLPHTRWACSCGAVDTRHHYRELAAVDPRKTLRNFAMVLDELSRTDAVGGAFDLDRFRTHVADHYLLTDTVGIAGRDWFGWADLAGRALYQ